LRRYTASILADKFKVSSKSIQELLRHSNIRTTEVYIQRIGNDIREVVERLSESEKRSNFVVPARGTFDPKSTTDVAKNNRGRK
jgi:hypothetical protein